MSHEFLREPLGNTLHGKARGEGVAQGVEVELAPARVDALDFSRFKVDADKAVGVRALRKDRAFWRGAGACKAFELFRQLGVQRHDGLLAVLGGGRADEELRVFGVELHVGPNELGKFSDAKTRKRGCQVEYAAFWRHRNEAFQLFVGKCAPFLLVAAHIDLRNLAQWVRRDAPVAIHPVEHRIQGVEVFVDRLRPKAVLTGAPCDITVGGNIASVTPAAFLQLTADARRNVRDVRWRAAQRSKVGNEVVKVRIQRLLCGFALQPWSKNARAFAFLLGDDFRKAFLRHLLVGGAFEDRRTNNIP